MGCGGIFPTQQRGVGRLRERTVPELQRPETAPRADHRLPPPPRAHEKTVRRRRRSIRRENSMLAAEALFYNNT